MSPTIKNGELVLTRKTNAQLQRGWVVISEDPTCKGRNSLKRVIGLPGEEIRLYEGMLFINGRVYRENYLCGTPSYLGLEEYMWSVGRNEVFLMGDNRLHSIDSRSFGPIKTSLVSERVLVKIFPWPMSKVE